MWLPLGIAVTKRESVFLIFLCLFLTLFFSCTLLIPKFLLDIAINLTGYIASSLSNTLGITASYYGGLLTVSGFRMIINIECTAIFFVVIFFSAVLAYPLHSFNYKIMGILLGSAFLLLMNIMRIIALGIIGARIPHVFGFFHTYLWQGIFVLVVFLTWFLWVKRAFVTMFLARFLGTSLLSSVIAVLLLSVVMESYVKVLAFVSERFLNILVSSSGFGVTALKKSLAFHYAGKWTSFDVSVAIYDSVIFFALIAASANAENMSRLVKQFWLGAGVLVIMHLMYVVTYGHLVIYGVDGVLQRNIKWTMRFISIIVPALVGLSFVRIKDMNRSILKEACL